VSVRVRIGSVVLVSLGLLIWASAAWAGMAQGGDGGNTVTVGASTPPSSAGPPEPGVTGAKGSGPGVSCSYTPITLSEAAGFALTPGGPTPGQWFLVQCVGPHAPAGGHAQWVPTPLPVQSPAAMAGPSPVVAAQQAEASIVLPAPSVQVNPSAFSVVNLPTLLAIDPALWHSYQATATAGGVSATATVVPQSVTWSMGDGGAVVCVGPGTPYDAGRSAGPQSAICDYTYSRSSYGQPSDDGDPNDGAFHVTATVTWTVTWAAFGAAGGGTLPSLTTSSNVPVRVEQVESIGVTS